jgi:hypothetical protein
VPFSFKIGCSILAILPKSPICILQSNASEIVNLHSSIVNCYRTSCSRENSTIYGERQRRPRKSIDFSILHSFKDHGQLLRILLHSAKSFAIGFGCWRKLSGCEPVKRYFLVFPEICFANYPGSLSKCSLTSSLGVQYSLLDIHYSA